jgi:hypothetical protein
MSHDLAGSVNGPNLYTYCNNDPVNLTDALGLMWGKEVVDYIREILEAIIDAANPGGPAIQTMKTADELDKLKPKLKDYNKERYEEHQELIDSGLLPGPNPYEETYR